MNGELSASGSISSVRCDVVNGANSWLDVSLLIIKLVLKSTLEAVPLSLERASAFESSVPHLHIQVQSCPSPFICAVCFSQDVCISQ